MQGTASNNISSNTRGNRRGDENNSRVNVLIIRPFKRNCFPYVRSACVDCFPWMRSVCADKEIFGDPARLRPKYFCLSWLRACLIKGCKLPLLNYMGD
jgi:hypothetical protein